MWWCMCWCKTARAQRKGGALWGDMIRSRHLWVALLVFTGSHGAVHEPLVYIDTSFLLPGLTEAMFRGTDATPSAEVVGVAVVTAVRVPVGVEPKQFGTAASDAVLRALNTDGNIFVSKLNPTLLRLGRGHLHAGPKGNWTAGYGGVGWEPSEGKTVFVTLTLAKGRRDYTNAAYRQHLANRVAAAVGVRPPAVSMQAVESCGTQGAACRTEWVAPTESGGGGNVHAPDAAAERVRVTLMLAVPSAQTPSAFCAAVRAALRCDTPAASPLTSHALEACGVCGETQQQPPHGGGGAATAPAVAEARAAEAEEACVLGWKPEAYGVMSNLYNVEADAHQTDLTLQQCVERCRAVGCSGFSRRHTLADAEPGDCWLKNTILPGAGDQFAFDGFRTYVVSCPDALPPCSWRYLDGHDLRDNDAGGRAMHALNARECRDTCQLQAACVGTAYDRASSTCYFLTDVAARAHAVPEDASFLSALCDRAQLFDPCEEDTCGGPASVCLPVRGGSVLCACAAGFACAGDAACAGVGVGGARACEPAASLETLVAEAVAVVLDVDPSAAFVTGVQELLVRPSPSPGSVDLSDKVLLTQDRVDLTTIHWLGITLPEGGHDAFVGRSAASLQATKAEDIARDFAAAIGLDESLVRVRSVCDVTPPPEVVVTSCVGPAGQPLGHWAGAPVVKDAPSLGGHAAADTWCQGQGAVLAHAKSEGVVQNLTRRGAGEVAESRTYWVSAACDAGCTQEAGWVWGDQTAVDWASLAGRGVSLGGDEAACAVLYWDDALLRWALRPAGCAEEGHYPLCTYVSPPDVSGRCPLARNVPCDKRLTLEVTLQQRQTHSFVTLPAGAGGDTLVYEPTLNLPPLTPVVTGAGVVVGVTDARGLLRSADRVLYPPPTRILNKKLQGYLDAFDTGGVTPAVALLKVFESTAADLLRGVLADPTQAVSCHSFYEKRHVRCNTATRACALDGPFNQYQTSCKGIDVCRDSLCNGNGHVIGDVGFCRCLCSVGFAGVTCDRCASKFAGYPACRANVVGPARFEVFRLDLNSPLAVVLLSPQMLFDRLKALFKPLVSPVEGITVRQGCPAQACAHECPTGPSWTWPDSLLAQCSTFDSAYTPHGPPPPIDGTSFVEVMLKYDTNHSLDDHASERARQLLKNELYSQNTDGLGLYILSGYQSTWGPSSDKPESVMNRTAVPAEHTHVDTADEAEKTVMSVGVAGGIAALTGACCLCGALLLGLRLRRHRYEEMRCELDRTRSEEEAALGEDFLVIHMDDAHEPVGILWDDNALLAEVYGMSWADSASAPHTLLAANTPAAAAGAEMFRNRRLLSVNGRRVGTPADIRSAVEGATTVSLQFEPRFTSVVVRVAEPLRDLDEEAFVRRFAERVAAALQLPEFAAADVQVLGAEEDPDACETELSLRFAGLTSGQVAAVATMCAAPDDPVRRDLPVAGAYLAAMTGATRDGGNMAAPTLWVCCQWLPEAAACSGCYLPLPVQGRATTAVWESASGDHWMYSAPTGHWVVTADKAGIGKNAGARGYALRTVEPHRGAPPQACGAWCTEERVDADVVVATAEPQAHGFVVGQRVMFPDDCTLEDGSAIGRNATGLAMGECGDLVRVCLLNEGYDVVAVPAEVLESPDGPRVTVFHEEKWMLGSVVKQVGDKLKVRFDCGLCEPVWMDRVGDADKLQVLALSHLCVGDSVELTEEAGGGGGGGGGGCLAEGELGVVIACGDLGQARPYLVNSRCGNHWYAAHQVSRARQGSHPFRRGYDSCSDEPEFE